MFSISLPLSQPPQTVAFENFMNDIELPLRFVSSSNFILTNESKFDTDFSKYTWFLFFRSLHLFSPTSIIRYTPEYFDSSPKYNFRLHFLTVVLSQLQQKLIAMLPVLGHWHYGVAAKARRTKTQLEELEEYHCSQSCLNRIMKACWYP